MWEFVCKAAALPTLPCCRRFSVGVCRQSRSPLHGNFVVAPVWEFACATALLCQFLQVSIGGSLIQCESSQVKPRPPNTVSSLLGQCGSSQVRAAALLTLPAFAGQHWRLAGKVADPPMLPWSFSVPSQVVESWKLGAQVVESRSREEHKWTLSRHLSSFRQERN